MATVNGYLNSIQSDLYVNGTEKDSIKTSIDAICTRLGYYFGNSEHNIHKIIKKDIFGSYSSDTMLSRKYDGDSDIDLMIVFEDASEYTPQTCLNWLKDFAEYWYSSSLVKQSLPTIVIELKNIKFELVPAYKNDYGSLYIAKDSSNWQYTNPKDLNDRMNKLNATTNYEFKRLIRTIKYWNVKKNYRRYKSYFLEKYLTEKFEISYIHCKNQFDYLDWAFYHLRSYNANDDYISGRIKSVQSYITDAQNYEKKYDYDSAVECIKKVIPET